MAPSRAENPMLNTDSLRRLLAVADVAKDPYAVADVAATLLAANPSDPAAADYRRALAHLKLPSTDPPAGAGGGPTAARSPGPAGPAASPPTSAPWPRATPPPPNS